MCCRLREAEVGYAERLKTRRIKEGSAAKVGNLDLPSSACAGDNKNVGRLQVFVQDSDSMCSGHGFGDVNKHPQADRSRDFIQSALSFRPLRQVRAGVFALKKERRRLEVPFEDANELRTFAERLSQEPRNRNFTL